jgi:hypothetical protein
MKLVSLILLVMLLLQPMACFAHPCDSSLGHQDSADTSGQSGSHTHSQDSDDCDSTVCCAEYVSVDSVITINYSPLVTIDFPSRMYQKLPPVVIPIFIPPQNLS